MAGLLLGVPGTAVAHGMGDGSEGVPGMAEKQLRAFESEVLGPEHAAEHARERALARETPPVEETNTPRAAAEAPSPEVTGAWADPFAIPKATIGIHALMLPTGKVMWFSYPRNPASGGNNGNPNKYDVSGTATLWNPKTGKFKSVPPPLWDAPGDGTSKKVPANIWCAGQAFLADGRVVIVGGNLSYPQYSDPSRGYYYRGLNQVYTFNPWNEKWTRQPDMPHGRWYPSEVLMPDGRMLILGGLSDEALAKSVYNTNKGIDIFKPSASADGVGTITHMTKDRYGGGTVTTDDDQHTPAHTGIPPDGGLYPHLFWMKDKTGSGGHVLVAGPDKRDSWTMPAPASKDDLVATDAQDPSLDRVWGAGVLVPDGPGGSSTVMEIGGAPYNEDADGNLQATNTTETYDDATDTWAAGPSLNEPRGHLNTVLLPDETMLAVGGGIGSYQPDVEGSSGQWGVTGRERNVELLKPGTGSWTLGAPETEARAYHSTALLLPDARVVSAGDDYNGPGGPKTGMDSDTAEVYSPPYLFGTDGQLKARPTIDSAPRRVSYGQSFHIATETGQSAVLVAPGATTHSNDMSQRVVPVTSTPDTGGLTVQAPAADNVALPSCYMLFTLDSTGTPSVASWVQLNHTSDAGTRCGDAGPPDSVPASGSASSSSAPPATPKSMAKAKDASGPTIVFTHRSWFNGRRGRIYGRAEDAGGVKAVKVALKAKRGRRCRWFSPKRRRFVRRSCGKAVWIKARVRESKRKGVYVWRVRLHRRVHAGSYRMAVRAVDEVGNATTRAGGHGFRISVQR